MYCLSSHPSSLQHSSLCPPLSPLTGFELGHSRSALRTGRRRGQTTQGAERGVTSAPGPAPLLSSGKEPSLGGKMAAPSEQVAAGDFGSWLDCRLEALGMDPEVYPAYIQGVLREEDNPEERDEALRGILAAFLEEDSIEDVCLEIITKWSEAQKLELAQAKQKDEVEALTSMMEKQAQIVVKPKEVSEGEQRRKAALLAQYANVTDDEDEDEAEVVTSSMGAHNAEKSLFKNTNLEDIVNAKKQERDTMREASQKKKEQDKQQREKDKQAKVDRKDKEKKRTQKGERKR